MSFKTSSVHNKVNRLLSSSKHETSPYYSRSSQSKQPDDQENDYSNSYFESGVDQRKYQSVQKQEAAPFIKDSYYSNAVSEYFSSEYGTNDDAKRKTGIEGKTILDSAYTTSSKGYSQLMKEKNARGSKYPGSEKKNSIVKGQDSESKNGQSNSQLRRKSYSGQSPKERTPVKRIPSSISAKPSANKKNFNREELQLDFHHEESFGEDKFMAYTRTLESDLDQVSLRLASSIRNDFEKTAHNILHQHINKHSSVEKDETYRSRENTNITPRDRPDLGFSEQSPYRSFDYNKRINLSVEKKTIPERYEEEDINQIPEIKEEKSVIIGDSEKNNWVRSEKKVGAGAKNVQKEFKSESKNNSNLEANKISKGLVSNEKKTAIKGQTAQKQAYSSKKPVQGRQREIEPVRNIEKQLFSPPMKSPSAGNEYGMSNQFLNSYGNNMTSASQRQEGIYAELALLDNLHVDEKISKLQEISIQLIKDHHYDDALDYLLEADVLIRNDLPANHPQQIYIHYLLGECFVKKGDYFRAQKVLGNAISKYEENDREYIKDSKHASYYLGLLVLQSHVFMSTKQFGHALDAYKKLVKGVESYCLTYERQNLKGIIPHILLIKYNMGECLKSLERREEADIIFHEVVTKFNIQDQEQFENFAILLNIGEHFMKRQFDRLAFEVLQRLCEITSSKHDLEKGDLELISLMHDDIANVLFNRKEYLNAAKHYENSFKIKVKINGMKNLKIGYLLLALGKAYYMASEYQKALHRFSSGLDVIESIEGRNTIYSANISLTMAKIHYALKDYKKAIHFYERSLDIYSKVMGYGHPYCLRIYANLIFVCFESGHTEKALEIANRILNMIKEMNNAEVFTMLNEIGNIYRKNEFFSEALNFYEIALEKLAHANQKEISTEAVNLVYTNIGSAHFHLHNHDEAVQYYKEAAKYFGRVDNGVNVHAVSIYINLVRLYKVLGKSNEAGAYLKKATGVLTLLEGDAVTKQNEESMQKLKHDLTALKKN